MSILYTPAGDTDPIRDFYDGAILHVYDDLNQKIAASLDEFRQIK